MDFSQKHITRKNEGDEIIDEISEDTPEPVRNTATSSACTIYPPQQFGLAHLAFIVTEAVWGNVEKE